MDIYTALCGKKDSDIAETYMTMKQTDSALAFLVRPDDASGNKEANAKFSKREADYQKVHEEKRYFEAALGIIVRRPSQAGRAAIYRKFRAQRHLFASQHLNINLPKSSETDFKPTDQNLQD